MALNDRRNGYSIVTELALGHNKTPKTVYAALAMSFAMRLCPEDDENNSQAIALMRQEWATLHVNGIVPQKVPKIPPASKPCFNCCTDTAYYPHRPDCPTQKKGE